MSPELRTAAWRGLIAGVGAAGLAFFSQLGILDATWREIISVTGYAFFSGFGSVTGWGVYDAQRAGKAGTSQHAARHAEQGSEPHD